MIRALTLLALLSVPCLAQQHGAVISWGASPTDATHDVPTNYNIKRATVAGDCTALRPTCVTVGSVPANVLTFADTSSPTNPMNSGQTFFWVVTAQNNSGESAPTAEVRGTIPGPFLPNTPPVPTVTTH